jgi:hypothetical protein
MAPSMRVLVLLISLLTGCGPPTRNALEQALARGAYVRIAETVVAGDRIEFWHEPRDHHFGPFIAVARDGSGRILDFCEGEFRQGWRPCAQTDRYSVLVANRAPAGPRAFFAYDAMKDRFFVHTSPQDDVHDGFVILGNRVLFSSCKQQEPVWLVDLQTGAAVSLGTEAPQAAEFHVAGPRILVAGEGKTWELIGDSLRPSRAHAPGSARRHTFESIRVASAPSR